MIDGFRTNKCDHEEGKECRHCTEGCEMCGELDNLNDSNLCEACAFSRAECAADMLHDSMKESD